MSFRCEWIWIAEVGTWASLWVYLKRVFMSKMSIQISESEMNFCSQKMKPYKRIFDKYQPIKIIHFFDLATQGFQIFEVFNGEDNTLAHSSIITEDTWAADSANVYTGGFRWAGRL